MLGTVSVTTDNRKDYFKREKLILKVFGISLSGNESLAYKIYSNFVMYCVIFPYVIVFADYLLKQQITVLLETLVYPIGISMAISVVAVTFRNRLNLGNLLKHIEQKPFLPNAERGGDEEEKLLNSWLSIKEKQSLVLCGGTAVIFISRVTITLSTRLRSNDYHDWEFGFGTISIINVTYSPNYEILWTYQNIVVVYTCVNIALIILILAAMLAFISIQFQMLQNCIKGLIWKSLADMRKNTSSSTSSTVAKIDVSTIPWKYLSTYLKEAVVYHLNIIQLATNLVQIFSNTILFMYLCAIGMFCLEVYRISTIPFNDARFIAQFLETMVVTMHSLLICYAGQIMTDESLKVAEAAYEANHPGVDLRFQKGLAMIIQRSQRPLIIKAGNFIDTSMVTYVWIVRTAYSTYMVLRQTQSK